MMSMISFNISAQDITLSSGKRTKSIKAGTFIQVELPVENREPCEKCSFNGVRGQVVSFADGKLNLRVFNSRETLYEEEKGIGYQDLSYKAKGSQPVITIPVDDILSITPKGKNKIKSKPTGRTIGVVIMLLGLGHMSAAPVVGITAADEANTLLWLGLSEFVAGIAIAAIVNEKTFITSENCPHKADGQKIWELK